MKLIILAVALHGLLSKASSSILPLKQDLSNFAEIDPTFAEISEQLVVNSTQDSTHQADVDLCNCGSSGSTKIIDGENAVEGEIPWRVYLTIGVLYPNGSLAGSGCGGTIISPRWILTAAHCYKGTTPDTKTWVGYGTIGKPQSVMAKRVIIHESFGVPNPVENDIALVELRKDLHFTNPKIQPACLPYQLKGQTERVAEVLASGWGRTIDGDDHSTPAKLLKVTLNVIGNKECQERHTDGPLPDKIYKRHWDSFFKNVDEIIKDTHICTFTPGKDTCQGDSGGSIDEQIGGKYYALGVVSYGHGCAKESPGVYTRVSEYTDWIETNTGVRTFCKA